jgi:1,4-dihydroxy-2-naphthoate octaprenyltransferase
MNGSTFLKLVKLWRFQFVFGGFLSFCIGALLALIMGAEFILPEFLLGYSIMFTAQLSVS